jgi:hypothetical protein
LWLRADAELGVRMRAQAGPAGRVQIGVAVDHQQAQPAQTVQDRAQRRELAQVELARPVGRYPGITVVRSASTCAKAASAARTAAVQQIAACILALTCYGNRVEDFGVPGDMSRRFPVTATALVALVALAGCGSSKPGSVQSPAAP